MATDNSNPVLLFLHGFPSSFYCWCHQIAYFSKQGYGCLAPNLMGYGLILFNVGYRAPTKFDFEQTLTFTKKNLGYETVGYWEFFDFNDAAKVLEGNPDRLIDLGYANDSTLWKTDFPPLSKAREWLAKEKTTTRASCLTHKDCEIIRKCITEGIQPKLNWYKSAIDNVDWDDEKSLDPTIKRPVLYVAAMKDYICISQFFADQKQYIADLKTIELETNQWTMEENPGKVNEVVEKWFKRIV
ncbi:unnamed protein product [Rotaria sp. Silwood1]|nr:unnamed protein product [Rotaria sp. Silwood1]CAF3429981.1 unnamed protein product [Rotaria sp. Silwood1]CAF4870603.1 unnamed protein product [Rotaria sp. Silwood1]